ncbi:MAG TPA: glycosyltransferase family 2 protein [Candidatus Sulfotelmatobacter sp.]|jgi:glycosyltransferase involved in cell wall biosynthesis
MNALSFPVSVVAPPETEDSAEMLDVSVVMPCLNESATIGRCVTKALQTISQLNLSGEVIVADNGSIDGSRQMASALGARVISITTPGYGAALQGAIAAARGQFVLMGDSDDSYDFTQLGAFLSKLREGYDLVVGNRFRGGISPGAMPLLHRYAGNPILSGIGNLLFKSPVGDFHCGLRAFRRDSIEQLRLQMLGMEFASEMIVKATLFGLRLTEIPTTLSPAGRKRASHLRTWRDGWRHLRFLLLYSPRWLFLYPGILLFVLGTMASTWLLFSPRTVGRITFDVDTLLFSAMAILLGFQSINFAAFTEAFAITRGFRPADTRLDRLLRHMNLETGLALGTSLLLMGAGMWGAGLSYWSSMHFGNLNPAKTLRLVIPGVVCLTLGFQVMLSSFFLSVLGIERQR